MVLVCPKASVKVGCLSQNGHDFCVCWVLLLKYIVMGIFDQTFAKKASMQFHWEIVFFFPFSWSHRKDLCTLLWFPEIQVSCSEGVVNIPYGVDSDKHDLFSPDLCQYVKLYV